MASECFTTLRLPRMRATLLDACGVPGTACSSVASDGIISIQQTPQYKEREELFVENGDGAYCVEDTIAPVLKWIDLTITHCNVDPELVNLYTAEPLVLNDNAVPVAVGFRTRLGSVALSNFAFEGWTRIANQSNCTATTLKYGYILFPWVTEATMGEVTYEKGAANFVITARAKRFSPWGTGPYKVVRSEATATLDFPMPLLTAIAATDFRHMQLTKLAPPLSACGCTAIPPATLSISPAGLVATLTFPSPTTTLPAVISWGDASFSTVTSGTTTPHTYSAPGTYTVTYSPKNYSSAPYTGTVTVA